MNWTTILSYIAGPILGGIIGLITNGIAIRMLFRPRYEKRIGKFRVPFTPGLIPKEKGRIARACGEVIGKTLLNAEVLKANLLSDDIKTRISDFIDSKTELLKDNRTTFNELFIEYFNDEKVSEVKEKTKNFLSDSIYKKLCGSNIGDKIGAFAIEELKKGSLYQTLSFIISDETIGSLQNKIAEKTDEAVEKYGRQIVFSVIESEMNNILDASAADLYAANEHRMDKIKGYFFDAYTLIIEKALAGVLNFINIPKLVEDRINSFDVAELETIILSIMKKELNAIVWLGGLLGLIMGFVMLFI